jgi:hypothetical protein
MALSAVINLATKEVQILNSRGAVMATAMFIDEPMADWYARALAHLKRFGITELLPSRSSTHLHVYAEIV